jgi:hypothetical protein
MIRQKITRLAVAIIALGFVAGSGQAIAASGSWNVLTAGNWSASSNWSGSVMADGIGATATINTNITAGRIITINSASRTVGILNIGDTNNSNSFTVAASGGAVLIFDNSGSNSQLNQLANSNGDKIVTPIVLKGSLDITNLQASSLLTISSTGSGITSGGTSGT